jgi:hypothetical protein
MRRLVAATLLQFTCYVIDVLVDTEHCDLLATLDIDGRTQRGHAYASQRLHKPAGVLDNLRGNPIGDQ